MNITEERIAELKQLVKEELDSYFDLFHVIRVEDINK